MAHGIQLNENILYIALCYLTKGDSTSYVESINYNRNIKDQWYILTLVKVVGCSMDFNEDQISLMLILKTTILCIHIAKKQYVMHIKKNFFLRERVSE